MSDLEKLVPPLELCRKIPAGEFENSALGHHRYCIKDGKEYYEVVQRGNTHSLTDVQYPAPTLQEIMAKLGQDYIKVGVNFRCHWICYVADHYGDEIAETDDGNPTTAALRLWMKLKGIEYGK